MITIFILILNFALVRKPSWMNGWNLRKWETFGNISCLEKDHCFESLRGKIIITFLHLSVQVEVIMSWVLVLLTLTGDKPLPPTWPPQQQWTSFHCYFWLEYTVYVSPILPKAHKFKLLFIGLQLTLHKSNSQKSINCLSWNPIQVLFSLFSIVFDPT